MQVALLLELDDHDAWCCSASIDRTGPWELGCAEGCGVVLAISALDRDVSYTTGSPREPMLEYKTS